MISGGDPYEIVDSALMPWAERNGIRITKLYRDDYVRSFWMFSRGGEVRAQLWLEHFQGERNRIGIPFCGDV
jgi:hypothetical protein